MNWNVPLEILTLDSVEVVHADKAVTTNLSPMNYLAMTPDPVSVGILDHLTEMSRLLPSLCPWKKVFHTLFPGDSFSWFPNDG